MKELKYLLVVLTAIFTISCAGDKGKYDYIEINGVEILGINSIYSVVAGSDLVIKPTLTRNLNMSEEGLTYSWTISGKEIATTKELDYTISNTLGFGEKECRFDIYDSKNEMRYFVPFKLQVLNPFNWGYYFLTEKDDTSTELGFHSVMNNNNDFAYADGIGNYLFGKKPTQIFGKAGNLKLDGVTTFCFFLTTMTNEGEYPILKTETATFYPNGAISDQSYIDMEGNYTLNPTGGVLMMMGKTEFYCSNGQLVSLTNNILYRPAKHDKTYSWNYPLINTQGATLVYAYDELSKKYYVLKPEITNIPLNIFTDPYAFDRVVPIQNFPSLEGHDFIGSNSGMLGDVSRPTIFTVKNGVVRVISFSYNSTGTITSPDFEKGVILYDEMLNIPNANVKSTITGNYDDWFFSAKNSIYIIAKGNISEFREFVTIPTELGDITQLSLSAGGTKLVITTYNSNSKEERKGSVVYADVSTGAIISTHPNSIHKCVSILSANSYYDYGVE